MVQVVLAYQYINGPEDKMAMEFTYKVSGIKVYSTDSQTKLALHHDSSHVTGSVKLNKNYKGGELFFPRQGVSNADIPVGKLLLFPGQVTHPHECVELTEGTKYSLTIWSQRYKGDIL